MRRFSNCHKGTHGKANQLLQHIERTWPYVGRGPGDPTNNVTERVIGLTYKIRAKAMRGFKSWDKALAHPYLSQYLRGENGVSDLRITEVQVSLSQQHPAIGQLATVIVDTAASGCYHTSFSNQWRTADD